MIVTAGIKGQGLLRPDIRCTSNMKAEATRFHGIEKKTKQQVLMSSGKEGVKMATGEERKVQLDDRSFKRRCLHGNGRVVSKSRCRVGGRRSWLH